MAMTIPYVLKPLEATVVDRLIKNLVALRSQPTLFEEPGLVFEDLPSQPSEVRCLDEVADANVLPFTSSIN